MPMQDMLVRLYDLPPVGPVFVKLAEQGIEIRRFSILEREIALKWVERTFPGGWKNELAVAFNRHPVTAFGAFDGKKLLGFAAYDCTNLNFFGPTGVMPEARGRNLGTGLLLAALRAMSENGYAYAVIGGVDGAEAFYEKTVDAKMIPGSTPGIYRSIL